MYDADRVLLRNVAVVVSAAFIVSTRAKDHSRLKYTLKYIVGHWEK